MTLHAALYPQGSRVAIRKGGFPIDAAMLGRTGTVLALSDYEPGRYGVVLDGEEQVREFREDELRRADG